MNEGTIVSLRLERGFGFIHVAGNGPIDSVFFHRRDLDLSLDWDVQLRERRVRFELVHSTRGARAVNVRPAD